MDLNLLVAFEALHRERSVTRAGRRLGLSQPATSAVLARLRAAFDDELFVTTPRGLEPTPRAEALAGPIARALADLRAAIEPGEFDPAEAEDTFRVGAIDAVLSVLLGPVAARVMKEAPRARVEVKPIDPLQAPALFEARELELAITAWPQPTLPAHVEAEALFPIDVVLATRLGHPLATGKAPRLAALATFPHVIVSFAGPGRTLVDEAFAAHGLTRHVAAVLGSFLAVPYLLGASDAVAIVPGPFARAHAAKGLVACTPLPPEIPQPPLVMKMLWPKRLGASAAHAWLREVVREAAASAPGRAKAQA